MTNMLEFIVTSVRQRIFMSYYISMRKVQVCLTLVHE